jgi:hypothetical protein
MDLGPDALPSGGVVRRRSGRYAGGTNRLRRRTRVRSGPGRHGLLCNPATQTGCDGEQACEEVTDARQALRHEGRRPGPVFDCADRAAIEERASSMDVNGSPVSIVATTGRRDYESAVPTRRNRMDRSETISPSAPTRPVRRFPRASPGDPHRHLTPSRRTASGHDNSATSSDRARPGGWPRSSGHRAAGGQPRASSSQSYRIRAIRPSPTARRLRIFSLPAGTFRSGPRQGVNRPATAILTAAKRRSESGDE